MNDELWIARGMILFSAHGKPYYELDPPPGGDPEWSPLLDALDFPGQRGIDDLTTRLKAKSPQNEIASEYWTDHIGRRRSEGKPVEREEFVEIWRKTWSLSMMNDFEDIIDADSRDLPVRLSGKDKVRWWSGWFHYPLDIEYSRLKLKESRERFRAMIDQRSSHQRDVVEEAYYEQVMRERLRIFERRRENWRVIRWASTTALGLVLAAWSLMQIVDRLTGG